MLDPFPGTTPQILPAVFPPTTFGAWSWLCSSSSSSSYPFVKDSCRNPSFGHGSRLVHSTFWQGVCIYFLLPGFIAMLPQLSCLHFCQVAFLQLLLDVLQNFQVLRVVLVVPTIKESLPLPLVSAVPVMYALSGSLLLLVTLAWSFFF